MAPEQQRGAAARAPQAEAPAPSWLPELSTKNVLLGVGGSCLLGLVHFWRQKQTVPFKACWALMWPTLGGGIMLAVQPDEQQLAKLVPPEELQKRREANEAIRRMAAGARDASAAQPRPPG